jgi:hypothetical protein
MPLTASRTNESAEADGGHGGCPPRFLPFGVGAEQRRAMRSKRGECQERIIHGSHPQVRRGNLRRTACLRNTRRIVEALQIDAARPKDGPSVPRLLRCTRNDEDVVVDMKNEAKMPLLSLLRIALALLRPTPRKVSI